MRRTAVLLAAVLLLLAGCSTSKDAVGASGEFTFVAPGGQTTIAYDPPQERGRVTGITGESLLHPGKTISLSDYAGQVVVLNIWGSWCPPCREEAPGLQLVQDATADEGAVVLGLDVRDDRQAAADFMRDRGLTYDSIFDFPQRNLARLGGYPRNAVPSTIVLDEQHRVAWLTLLPISVSELIPVVERLAAEPAPAVAPA
ncbi:MAG: TlpA family protein disulfide reductase [Pseudonocardia sp.]|nr:TlpA family protein disulfide reductase [Pseudonocardia sp.]